jgi:hypothetical protein
MPSTPDFDSLRGYVPARPRDPSHAVQSSSVSVMDWLLAVGRVVARKMKPIPTSPMVRIHPRR